MEELGDDKLEDGEKDSINSAISELEKAMESGEKEHIEQKLKSLTEASGKMAERLYANQENVDSTGGDAAGAEQQEQNEKPEDVVDAEFEEVKDEKK